jgi:cytochrome c-type biogenesis protein
LIIISSFFGRLGHGYAFWRFIKGRVFEITVPRFGTLHLHTTSVASGILLVLMGVLLATGNLTSISEWTRQTTLAQFSLSLEEWLSSLLRR